MLELFGFAWVTITFTCCVAAISTRRSVLRWLKARADRKRLDDTVEIVRRPLRRLATYAALVVLAVPAGVLAGGTALPGPLSAAFTGGTVANAVVLTGDNASGTGTLRIRPADEDTQVVLCEASNNAATEMCTSVQHVNNTTSTSAAGIAANMYFDSTGAVTRNWTSAGWARVLVASGSSAANNAAGFQVYGTGGSEAGLMTMAASGLTASTLQIGSTGTVTTDIRGPILNGGSATCNGIFAGTVCYTDDLTVAGATNSIINFQSGTTATAGGITFNVAGAAVGSSAYYGSTFSDADYADKVVYAGFSKLVSFVRTDNVGNGTAAFEWRDNTTATGVLLMDVLGNGTVRPLLYGSQSNCSDGAGAAACSAAPAGSVVIDDGATTVVVSTTAVTANSQIVPVFDSSLGTKLGVTCNTTAVTPSISARTAGTSFTITAADPAGANPACFSYFILN